MRTWSATILGTLSVLSTLLLGNPAQAASLRASCHLEDAANDKIDGVNVDDLYPIASVSKIMTAYWAVSKMGVNGRFATTIHIRRVNQDTSDIHFAGSRDPYFGKWALQYVVSELNRMGVSKVRKLTYDEKFKYLNDTTGDVAHAHFDNHEPSSDRVGSQLKSAFSNISGGYDGLKVKVKRMRDMSLPASIKMKVEEITFASSDDFSALQYDSSYVYRSTKMHKILKEMNRNSNNYAANNIFESLGGPEKFRTFIKDRLNLGSDVIRFVNGSGDSKITSQGKIYNEATCRAVIKVIQALRSVMRNNGMGLHSVMAVTGRSAPGEKSTTDMYKNDQTDGALIAKTGTVNPAITLAGMMSTEEGNIYFGYIYKTDGSGGDWRAARQKIKVAVTAMIKEHGGGDGISDHAESFLAMDEGSKLTEVDRMN